MTRYFSSQTAANAIDAWSGKQTCGTPCSLAETTHTHLRVGSDLSHDLRLLLHDGERSVRAHRVLVLALARVDAVDDGGWIGLATNCVVGVMQLRRYEFLRPPPHSPAGVARVAVVVLLERVEVHVGARMTQQ